MPACRTCQNFLGIAMTRTATLLVREWYGMCLWSVNCSCSVECKSSCLLCSLLELQSPLQLVCISEDSVHQRSTADAKTHTPKIQDWHAFTFLEIWLDYQHVLNAKEILCRLLSAPGLDPLQSSEQRKGHGRCSFARHFSGERGRCDACSRWDGHREWNC